MSEQPRTPEQTLDGVRGTPVKSEQRKIAPRTIPWLGASIRLFILLLVGGLIAFVAHEWDWWVGSSVHQSTDDAYLQADLTPLAAKVPGYVRRVPVQDFQRVKAGDLLVEIVDDDYHAQLDQAQANVTAAKAAIQNVEQQKLLQDALIKQAQATIAATEADVTRYHLETVRQQTLLSEGRAGTPQITEQAVDNEKRAEATLALNRAQLEQQRQQLNVLENQEKQAHASLNAQQAARELAEISLGTLASRRRWTAWLASARCAPASTSARGQR